MVYALSFKQYIKKTIFRKFLQVNVNKFPSIFVQYQIYIFKQKSRIKRNLEFCIVRKFIKEKN